MAVLALATMPAAPTPGSTVRAATPPTVELAAEGTGVVGGTVTITAVLYDASGAVVSGKGTSVRVRFYFTAESPNDIVVAGNRADLDCTTGTVGWCQVAYVAAHGGTDTICAVVAGPASGCLDAGGSSPHADQLDVTIDTQPPTPTPATFVAPTPTPSPTPAAPSGPVATPTPAATPTSAPSSKPSPKPTPSPSPTADPTPSPRTASDSTAAGGSTSGPADPTSGSGPAGEPAPRPLPPRIDAVRGEPPATVHAVVDDVAKQIRAAVDPVAVVAVASTFTFPLSLMAVVLLFLLVQGRLDGRDPKVRTARRGTADATVPFVEESDL
jgi:hypothetical protein